MEKLLKTPITDQERTELKAGQEVLISGIIYTGRDTAHQRLVDAVENNLETPFDFEGQIIYYVGPTPAKPGQIIGSCGPTSSYRMDKFSPKLMAKGLKVMIGKGERTEAMINSIKQAKAVNLIAIGGIGALLSKTVKSSEVIAYSELGTEAIRKLEVENFPAIVAIDSEGKTIFK